MMDINSQLLSTDGPGGRQYKQKGVFFGGNCFSEIYQLDGADLRLHAAKTRPLHYTCYSLGGRVNQQLGSLVM